MKFQQKIFNIDYEDHSEIKDWIGKWDFKGSNTKTYTHGIHKYPAMFIPQLARKIIKEYSKENDTVLDIFCGSGTTLVESLLLNRKAIGIELNPLAVKIAKTKTTKLNEDLLLKDFEKIKEYIINTKTSKEKTKFFNKEFWFKDIIANKLDIIKEAVIKSSSNDDLLDFFTICLSEIIKNLSFSKNSEFKLVRDKRKLKEFNPNVFEIFIKTVEKNLKYIIEFSNTYKSQNKAVIYQNDSTIPLLEKNSIDLILTSPPYGDSRTTVAYGQFCRLSSQFLGLIKDGFDLDTKLLGGKKINSNEILKTSETLKICCDLIGQKDSKRVKDVICFYEDLYKVIKNSYSYLKNDKFFILVVGNRTVKGITLRTDIIISEMSAGLGFSTDAILFRNIINKRMPSKNSPTNKTGKLSKTMTKESIIILRKIF